MFHPMTQTICLQAIAMQSSVTMNDLLPAVHLQVGFQLASCNILPAGAHPSSNAAFGGLKVSRAFLNPQFFNQGIDSFLMHAKDLVIIHKQSTVTSKNILAWYAEECPF